MSVGTAGQGILLDDAPGKRDRALNLLDVAARTLTADSFQQRDWLAQQIQEFLHYIEYERSA